MRYPTQSRHIAEDRAVAQGGRGQFSRWIARHKEFRDEYTLAHEFRAEDLAEEMVEIADDPSVLVQTIAPQDVCAFEEPTTSMTGPCFFMPLNLIELNGDDLRRDPLEVRKATLASVVAKPRPACTSTSTLRPNGPPSFAHACKLGLEGIVSKRRDSPRSGRSSHWIKSKNPDAPAARREAEEDWAR